MRVYADTACSSVSGISLLRETPRGPDSLTGVRQMQQRAVCSEAACLHARWKGAAAVVADVHDIPRGALLLHIWQIERVSATHHSSSQGTIALARLCEQA
jgi:hypothetical protein